MIVLNIRLNSRGFGELALVASSHSILPSCSCLYWSAAFLSRLACVLVSQRTIRWSQPRDRRPEPAFAFAAVDHHVVEQVVMTRALPDLRMHDERGFDADHRERLRSPLGDADFVVPRDHVAPPRLADVAFEFDAERTVIPKAVQAAVDFGGLKNKAPVLAEGDDLVHFLGHNNFSQLIVEFHESRQSVFNPAEEINAIAASF